MARINLEDQFWLDVMQVAIKMGDQDKAIGNAARWFRFAQEHHKHGKFVTDQEFQDNGFSENLFPFFAERVDGGIQAKGAAKYFGWLQSKVEAGKRGGIKSGEARRSKSKQTEAKASKPKQAEPSPSYSSSLSSSDSRSTSHSLDNTNTLPVVSAKPAQKGQLFVATYCECFKAQYGFAPEVTPQDAKNAKSWVKDMSPDKIQLLIKAYFALPDSWLVKTKHPIPAFKTKLNEISVFANSGNFTTTKQMNQADDFATITNQLQRVREGKL